MNPPRTLDELEALLKQAPSTRDRLLAAAKRRSIDGLKGDFCPNCGPVDLARHTFCDHELDAFDEKRR